MRVDKQQLGRALVNLFDNADRHAGGVRAVTVQRVRDQVRIDVDDRGDGVPEGDRERIFERFVRAGSRGSLPGSGLGLSIVAETANSLGGRGVVRGRAGRRGAVRHGAAGRSPRGTGTRTLTPCRCAVSAGMRRTVRVRPRAAIVAALVTTSRRLGAARGMRAPAQQQSRPGPAGRGALRPPRLHGHSQRDPDGDPGVLLAAGTIYLADAQQQLVAVPVQVPDGQAAPMLQTLLNRLAVGPSDQERARGLVTDLGPGSTIVLRSISSGTANIELQSTGQDPSPSKLPVAVGQIVLTATSIVGIDRVVFARDGVAMAVPGERRRPHGRPRRVGLRRAAGDRTAADSAHRPPPGPAPTTTTTTER